jgi:flagellar basal body-associated protein FliL
MRGGKHIRTRVGQQQKATFALKGSSIIILFVTVLLLAWGYMVYSARIAASSNISYENTVPIEASQSQNAQHIVPSIEIVPNLPVSTLITPKQAENVFNRKMKIAYAITLTKDGFFQDCAAVLSYSIYNISKSA